ncbi:MAG TPA: mandelate racemase/muconate lactonizing enzyme family protein [Solirubrobacterales bacterium]|nr:mandelate racemase/muconate lactonizing enzyme family protein [Solirubrobacterales bacterium]
MRVERVETVAYSLPFAEPYVTARGEIREREMVLLRLRTDAGWDGLGEAVPLALRGDKPLAKVEAEIADAARRLTGLELDESHEDPLAFGVATMLELSISKRISRAASAAIECALFDAVAKASGIPVWGLLKVPGAEPVEVNATLTSGTPDEVAAEAAEWAGEGYRTVKLKLGAGHDDVATVEAVREAVGPGVKIRLDANEAWDAKLATDILRLVEAFGIELAEQPVSGLRAMARVAGDVGIPLAADEAISSEAEAHRAVQRGSCAYATAKLSKVGGFGPARQIARILPTYLSSALDGPVGIAAAAHGAQVLRADGTDPGIAHGLATQRLFAETIASRECELRDGMLHLPEGPGLGVELDEDALERHSIPKG